MVSRLYNLPPQGIGTPEVESLSSYTKRLAEAHSLSPNTLISYEILPHMYEQNIWQKNANKVHSFWSGYSHIINGMTPWTENFVRVLQNLTSRNDLYYLTLLPLSRVVSWKSTVRKHHVWCPHCYTEQKEQGQEVYDHLLWAIDAVTVCPVHSTPLATYCLSCGKEQRVLRQHSRVGYCLHCRSWLGTQTEQMSDDLQKFNQDEGNWSSWKTEVIGELLTATSQMPGPFKSSDFLSALDDFRTQCFGGSESAMARWIGIKTNALVRWRQGSSAPSLAQLLQVCYRLDITLLALLTNQPDGTVSLKEGLIDLSPHSPYTFQRRTLPSELQAIKQALDEALQEEPPPSLAKVGRRIGKESNAIRPHFKEECSTLIERYRIWKQSANRREVPLQRSRGFAATDPTIQQRLETAMREQPPVTLTQVACELDCTTQLLRRWYPTQCARIVQRAKDKNIDWSTVEHALQEAMHLQSPPFPSVNELARQFGAPDQALRTRFPDICRTLSARYQMKHWATVQQQLEEILTEESPPSLEEVSRQLGYSASTLKWRFPELCQEIVQRYAAFRQERSRQRKQQLCEEIQQVVRDLHEQGIYPNKAKTQRYMNKPMVFMEPTCSEAWRAAMKELGYSIDDDEQSTDESTS